MKASDFIAKPDVRQILKIKRSQTKRIEHPHAHYNQVGRISCLICGVQIKSEHAWHAHVLSKSHKQNVANVEARCPSKRPSSEKQRVADPEPKVPRLAEVGIPPKVHLIVKQPTAEKVVKVGDKNPAEKCRESSNDSKLPEGFFDDKIKDAKVRNVPYKDKMTEEVELFAKEMSALERESEDMMEKESELMVSGRELAEIDTQMQKWKHFEQLQIRAESLKTKAYHDPTTKSISSSRSLPPSTVIKPDPDDTKNSNSSDDEDEDLYNFRTKSAV